MRARNGRLSNPSSVDASSKSDTYVTAQTEPLDRTIPGWRIIVAGVTDNYLKDLGGPASTRLSTHNFILNTFRVKPKGETNHGGEVIRIESRRDPS